MIQNKGSKLDLVEPHTNTWMYTTQSLGDWDGDAESWRCGRTVRFHSQELCAPKRTVIIVAWHLIEAERRIYASVN